MASIFKALDGAHLDRALFGAHLRGPESKNADDTPDPTTLSRQRSRDRRGDDASQDGGPSTGTPRSDAGL